MPLNMPFLRAYTFSGRHSKPDDALSNIRPIGLSPFGSDVLAEQALLLELTYDYLLFTQDLTNQFFLILLYKCYVPAG